MANRRDGIVLGRFQPFHLGHLEYLEAAAGKCARLFIGITNPDPASRTSLAANRARSLPENNPFSYLDRALMIEAALVEAGWHRSRFCLTPAPILLPSRLASYLPPPGRATCFITIYDVWGQQKVEWMRQFGYDVDVLWTRAPDNRVTSGTEIRAAIRSGDAWSHLVPSATARYIESHVPDAAAAMNATQGTGKLL